jgi:hypothetical protein
MPSVAFVAPILPGKSDIDRANTASCDHGDRHDDFVASRRRAGITREAAWLQPTPMGDVAVVYMEADDLEAAFKALGTSEHPFDEWFRDNVREVHGINLEDGFPPPEQLLDFTA